MKNKMYNAAKTLFIICALSLVLSLTGCLPIVNREKRARQVLENKGIYLQDHDKVLYSTSDCNWMGDGTSYYVIQFAEEPTDYLNNRGYYSNRYTTCSEAEKEEYRQKFEKSVKILLNHLSVSEKYRPDWGSDYIFSCSLEDNNFIGIGVDERFPKYGGCYEIQTQRLIFWFTNT